MTPFDYVKSINNKKQYINDCDEYLPFIINSAFSLYNDTIFNSNEMNLNSHLPQKMQYDYYFYGVRKKYRFTPWHKKLEKNEDLSSVQQYYKYNSRRAKEVLTILSPNQLKIIKERTFEGGT